MQSRELCAEPGRRRRAAQLHEFHDEPGTRVVASVAERSRSAHAGGEDRLQALGLGGKRVAVARVVHLHEISGRAARHGERAVDAPARHRPCLCDRERVSGGAGDGRFDGPPRGRAAGPQAAINLILASVRRSTRIAMNARSKRCLHASEARSRSSVRIVMMRASLMVETSAMRSLPVFDRYAISPKHSPGVRTLSSFLRLVTLTSPPARMQNELPRSPSRMMTVPDGMLRHVEMRR